MHFVWISMEQPLVDTHGRIAVETKTLSGMREYALEWKGRVTLAYASSPVLSEGKVGFTWITEEAEDFDIMMDGAFPSGIIAARPDVVLALHSFVEEYKQILDAGLSLVLTSEYNLRTRIDIQLTSVHGPVARARMVVGLLRREHVMRRFARRAAGLQFNGHAAERSYGRLNSRTIQYHDHRMSATDVGLARDSTRWDGDRPLRLGFSGRLIAMKGPQYFVALAAIVLRTHPEVEFHVLGTGVLEESLRAQAGRNVHFHGFVDFEADWKPMVRDSIDIMVLPHVQGDPSCTYFEAMACGAPILGFANDTLAPLVKASRVGWVVDRGDTAGLAQVVDLIIQDPTKFAIARENALQFMAEQDFSSTSRRRIRHLTEIVQASSRD